MSSFGFIPDVLFIIMTFIFFIKFNEKIVHFISQIKISNFFLFLLVAIFLTIIEENINWGAIGYTYSLLPWTLVPLVLALILIGGAYKIARVSNYKFSLYTYIILGMLWELFFGGLKGQHEILPFPFYLFMIFFVGLSYAYISYIPLKIWYSKKN